MKLLRVLSNMRVDMEFLNGLVLTLSYVLDNKMSFKQNLEDDVKGLQKTEVYIRGLSIGNILLFCLDEIIEPFSNLRVGI